MFLLDRISSDTKIKYGLKALGFTGNEKEAVDSLIAEVGTHPLTQVIIGTEIASVEQTVSYFTDQAGTEESKELLARTGKFLSNPAMRSALGQVVVDFIQKSEDPDSVYSAIGKVASMEMLPWSNTDFPDVQTFIAEGPLLVLSRFGLDAGKQISDGESPVFQCSHCDKYSVI